MNHETLRDTLAIIALRCEDGMERNMHIIEHSPYKTRQALADRNREHYQSLRDQVHKLWLELGPT